MMKIISIITPCYNEELNVEDCHKAVVSLFENDLAGYDYEHIFADNCSRDSTPEKLRDLAAKSDKVKVILNARNFGPFRSSFNALKASEGDAVVMFLAADLQDPPELIAQFVELWEQGNKVVYGIRANREEGFVLKTCRKIYYRTVNTLAHIELPPNVGEFQLIDNQIVKELRKVDDYYPYTRGLIAYCGFKSTGIEYTWKSRKKGVSKNNLWDLIDQAVNGIISFTSLPLRFCMFIGFSISFLSIIYSIVQLIINLLSSEPLAEPGVRTLIVALFFFSGVQLFAFGLLGEYIGAIHNQVRKKPMVVEDERINMKE